MKKICAACDRVVADVDACKRHGLGTIRCYECCVDCFCEILETAAEITSRYARIEKENEEYDDEDDHTNPLG